MSTRQPEASAWRAVARAAEPIRIGTSGWHYASWLGPFFPRDLRRRDHLRFYAERFPTAELNGVFYRTPTLAAVRGWREQTPDGFVFAWKASKFITHWKRLGETCRNSLALMESRLDVLGPKAGPVLFQLPPRMTANRERIAAFLQMLPKRRRFAFEFRHPSWYEDAILDVLRDHDAALCLSDHHDAPAPWQATAGHVYVRAHGPGGHYRGRYPRATLERWAAQMTDWARQGRAVYCYFDNDQKSAAPRDARRLIGLVEACQERLPGAGVEPRFHPRRPAMPKHAKQLDELFHDALKDIYFAEKKILTALPKMAKAVQSDELRAAFRKHEGETEEHVDRLERVFAMIDKKPQGKTCDAIVGIIDEGNEIAKQYKGSAALDAGLLAGAQAVEHYEIARYGTLKTWAEELGLGDAVGLLDETLQEEKATDEALTEIAESGVNQQAQTAA
jgi:uncharacterized protein YecE (DUF72 family)/ferritin-like metal-binding protein YciE